MILSVRIETSEEELKRCIIAACKIRFGDKLEPDEIKDFAVGDEITTVDAESMLMGSSLGQLANMGRMIMTRTA